MAEPLVRCPVCGRIIDTEQSWAMRNPVFRSPVVFALLVTGLYYLVLHNFIYGIIWGALSATDISPWVIVPPIWYALAAIGVRGLIVYRFVYPPALHGVHLLVEGRSVEAKRMRRPIIIYLIIIALVDIPGRMLLKFLMG